MMKLSRTKNNLSIGFPIPDIQLIDASFDRESVSSTPPAPYSDSLSGMDTKYGGMFNLSQFLDKSKPHVLSRDKVTLDGEFEPESSAFVDLLKGMSTLRNQVDRLCENSPSSHPALSESIIYSSPPRLTESTPYTPYRARVSRDMCATPMTSSPLNSSTEEDMADISISPIKETTLDNSNILERARIEKSLSRRDQEEGRQVGEIRPVQRQLTRRASVAENLTSLKNQVSIENQSVTEIVEDANKINFKF